MFSNFICFSIQLYVTKLPQDGLLLDRHVVAEVGADHLPLAVLDLRQARGIAADALGGGVA